MSTATETLTVPRTLGRWDLVLLKIVAIVNINNVPPVAVYGRASLILWGLAFALFFIPEAIAVLTMSRRFPGEGGIYLWTRRQFGEAHGFISGWCYWTNNLFYVPVLLVYMAGLLAFAAGPERATVLVNSRVFVATVAFGWLAIIAMANIRGMAVGKWIQNIGGFGTAFSIVLVLLAAMAAFLKGTGFPRQVLYVTGGEGAPVRMDWSMATSFAVMCNAFVGIELASCMGDEIRDPQRDLPPAIFIAGGLSLASYVLVTAAVLMLVPIDQLGVIQGVMQAVSAGAKDTGLGWMVAPLAILMGLSIGGGASAWFAGSSRVPFVAGLTNALPAALGRLHPRYRSPYVALGLCAILAALFTLVSLIGSSVGEAYQVLLKSAVVIQLVPFIYLFFGLATLPETSRGARAAGEVGLAATVASIIVAFWPTADVNSVWLFETKLALGIIGPMAVGWFLFTRAR